MIFIYLPIGMIFIPLVNETLSTAKDAAKQFNLSTEREAKTEVT